MKRLLNDFQLDRLSEFTANLGLVFFVSMVMPLLLPVDRIDPFMILSGLGITCLCLVFSLFLVRGVKK